MKTFNIYKHPNGSVEAVKIGFSWPAFVFCGVWLLVKKLWGLAVVWFAVWFSLLYTEHLLDEWELKLKTLTDLSQLANGYRTLAVSYFALSIGYICSCLILGFRGNKWTEVSLLTRGFVLVGAAQARTPSEAIENLSAST